MFFADNLLTDKKSPLGIAWLAATLGPKNANKRVTRKELSRYDLVNACEYISEPPEPLALRTSGILLYGVARVFNQHYEEFQQHVTRFHSDVQRAIQTNFSTTVNGRIAGNQGIDLLDEGKSKLDAITFAGVDFGWQSGIDYEMRFINWSDPLEERSRRESSKLNSQLSQTTRGEDEDESEDEDDDMEREGARTGKPRKYSSPYGLDPKHRSPHLGSDRRSQELLDDQIFTGEMELFNLEELEGMGDNGPGVGGGDPNSSFSNPEPMGEAGDITMEDLQLGEDLLMQDALRPITPPADGEAAKQKSTRTPKSARKRRAGSAADDLTEVEEIMEKKKKIKTKKTVKFDKNLEMPEESEQTARRRYQASMDAERAVNAEKQGGKDASVQADKMVDSAGGWMSFMDEEMTDLFTHMSANPGQWKHELDAAAYKLGNAFELDEPLEDGEEISKSTRGGGEPFDGMDGMMFGEDGNGLGMGMGGQDDPFLDVTNNDTTGYQDFNHDFMEPLHDPSSRPARKESADVEAARRLSQSGRVSLPWDTRSLNDYDDLGPGADSSFDAGSLHLTNMTPQEARLRLSSKSLGKTGSLDALVRRARSRSGSVLDGRAPKPAQMLTGGEYDEDESLPQHVKDIADQPSQYLQLPDAYRPEMLAMLDVQCRFFLQFVEKRMITDNTDDVEFDSICPPDKTKKTVACQAFYNVLTLTTKKILKVDQPDAFDSFTIQFTAQVKI